jgi:hypothetical protein
MGQVPGQALDDLRPIPTDLDLIDGPDQDVREGNTALKPACRRLMAADWIAVANSTGVLHLLRPMGHSGDVCAAAFSPDPDGRWVASAGGGHHGEGLG